MSGKSKKTKTLKEDQQQKSSNRVNKGKSIGGWSEQQMQVAYDE